MPAIGSDGTVFTVSRAHFSDRYVQRIDQVTPEQIKEFSVTKDDNFNKYFPGHAIKMPKPLSDGQVTFDDGSPATVAQYSKDVTTFLMWTAEPHMEERKRLGMQVFIFLIIFTGLMYFTKKKVWHDVKLHPEKLTPRPPPTAPPTAAAPVPLVTAVPSGAITPPLTSNCINVLKDTALVSLAGASALAARLLNVRIRLKTRRLRSARRSVWRARLAADFVLAM